jgi:hypothetical protein
MRLRHLLLSLLCLVGLIAVPAIAAGTVQLNLIGDTQSASLSFQDWSQALGKAGIRNVRIQSGVEDNKPGIVTEGSPDSPVYIVTGVITSRDEILLPGVRFRRSDVAKLAVWLKDLAENGPVAGRPMKSSLGLSGDDFSRVRKDLGTPIEFSTLNMTCRQVVQKIAGQLKFQVKLDADIASVLADDKVQDELTGLSCGTAIACVLRPAGYWMTPRAEAGTTVYEISKASGKPTTSNIADVSLATLKSWPVGWVSDKSDRDAVPALYEFHSINIQNIPAATALEAIGKRLKIPVLIDHKALAQQKIDPAKTLVSLPKSKTFYASALRRMLFQARLKCEVRYDDAGSPFLWVTTGKQVD